MRLKSPIAGVLLACVGLVSTSSCVSDPILPSQSELFNREFIKNFGISDPNHDWNHSKRVNVTVSTNSPTNISISASIDGNNYLFGTFLGVNGTKELGVDIPKGVSEIIVSGGSISLKAKDGDRLNFSNASSRVLADVVDDPFVKVTSLASQQDKWMVIPWLNGTIFRRKMPEDYYNADREGVSPDFMFRNDEATPVTFIVRPLFWQTSRKHKLGIFYYNAAGEKVHLPIWEMTKTDTYSDDLLYGKAIADVKYVRVPVADFQSYMNEYNLTMSKLSANDNFDKNCSSADDRDMTKACRKYLNDVLPVLQGRTDGKKFNFVYRWKFLTEEEGGKDDLLIVYTYFNYHDLTGPGGGNNPTGQWPTTDGAIPENPIPSEKPEENKYYAIVSKGIEITIQPGLLYGFYLEDQDDSTKRYYSTRSENNDPGWYPVGERNEEDRYTQFEKRGKASYAATWVGTKYNWRYLAFEDWNAPDSGFSSEMKDLNDMVFIIEESNPTSTLIDIEHGDKIKPNIPYEWVVATEDLGTTDDFDFNDLVFGVSNFKLAEDGETATVDVRALASGGTLPIYLCYTDINGDKIRLNDGKEFHSWFEGSHSSSQIINASGYRAKGQTITITVPKDFAMSCCQKVDNPGQNGNMGGFSVEVEKDGRVVNEIHAPNLDNSVEYEAPQMICVPMDWCWPTERTHILEVYDLFDDWVGNATGFENWHDTRTEGKYFVRTDIPKPVPSKPTPDKPWGDNEDNNPTVPSEGEASVDGPNKVYIGWDIYEYKVTIPTSWLKVKTDIEFTKSGNNNIVIFSKQLSSWDDNLKIKEIDGSGYRWTLTTEDITKLGDCISGENYILYIYINGPDITKITIRN